MGEVVIDGADRPLGRRVAEVLGLWPAAIADGVVGHPGRSRIAVVTAAGEGAEVDGTGRGLLDPEHALGLLDRTGEDLEQVVVVSSAMVYGARSDNPVPLSEDAPVRPNAGCRFAERAAQFETGVERWRAARPGVRVAVLRPVVMVDAGLDGTTWVERSQWSAAHALLGDEDPPAQFGHLDDLVNAVVHALHHRLDGVYNVAPDGALSRRMQRELVGAAGPTVRIPTRLTDAALRARWALGALSTPPDASPYAVSGWVVANDRLRSTGWAPGWRNEEAFVVSHRAGWWAGLDAGRRQAVSLGAAAAVMAVAGAGVAAAVRRVTQPR